MVFLFFNSYYAENAIKGRRSRKINKILLKEAV